MWLNELAQADGAVRRHGGVYGTVRRHGGVDGGKDKNYMNFYPKIARWFDGAVIFFSECMRCSLRFY
jgi:hypothetical protein